MEPRTKERAEQWDSRPFSGGYDGLSDLASSDFSGAVVSAGTWLFMLNGRIVGVVDGELESFEAASGTIYDAPHPALPLLCTMEETGGETRARYYTNKTPLREVDETLQHNSFTGYVELSENVLSGDYYAVYYGGRRMAAAYIGNAERLLTGEEAFERADDEVGIYEVRDVEIDVTDVPGRTSDDASAKTQASSDPVSETEPTAAPETEPTASSSPEDTSDSEPPGPETPSGRDDSTDDVSVPPSSSSLESIDIAESTAEPDDRTPKGRSIEDIALEETLGEETTVDTSNAADHADSSTPTEPEGTDLESAPSGITSSSVETHTYSDPEDQSVTESNEQSPAEPETGVPAERSTETPGDGIDPSPPTDRQPRESEPKTTENQSAVSTETADEPEDESTADGDADPSDPGPDLAEVEAAAEQLEQNDISWTEDDVDATTEEPESTENGERFDEEEQWRETRNIPSIDPDNTQEPTTTAEAATRTDPDSRSTVSRSSTDATATQSTALGEEQRQRTTPSESAPGRGKPAPSSQEQDDRVADLTEQVGSLEDQRDALVRKYEELEADRDRLKSENEELSSTVERLQARIDDLEQSLQQARETQAPSPAETDSTPTRTELSRQRALSDTNLFVRYASKSQPTLDTAHDANADRSEVASNLRLEHHTGFDAADVAVDGEPFDDFLTGTMEHQFVTWLTETVLYEVRDTGKADALADLYDAIPRIDRAELGASISLTDDETEHVPDEVTFDVVAFDKMGNPLVVANLNDSRQPATQGMLEEMEEAASAVKANYQTLAAAMVVTSSYFEPGALEVTERATGGGFLSRGSKLSYVSLSRKQGYHLCLVEARSEGFHMNVPEL
ncbi:DUF7527 domain-containing protein [Natronorubrum daqingense]|uniref:Transcriptional regulator n=1 Tax=Natronorubrum daqingense TaxID=588898 RepID=A0A1N6YER6_9EURY|nr:transcriptional regulator [Natronorubrum daqingense]APX95691.1 transcriptional regulator [Natronorubrum daqingense]SIR13043.1 hypothetical protein SAMN05421809_0418 [Natronorubrum daqingense]